MLPLGPRELAHASVLLGLAFLAELCTMQICYLMTHQRCWFRLCLFCIAVSWLPLPLLTVLCIDLTPPLGAPNLRGMRHCSDTFLQLVQISHLLIDSIIMLLWSFKTFMYTLVQSDLRKLALTLMLFFLNACIILHAGHLLFAPAPRVPPVPRLAPA